MGKFLILGLILLVAGCGQPVYRQGQTPLPVAAIEVERYLGVWREQARLPNSFQNGCTDVTAAYGLRPDGLISVRNACRTAEGRERSVEGRARLVGAPGEGKLEVSFFGPFWGDYWVLERADDYSWAIVGEPAGRYLWVLTRDQTIAAEQRALLAARVGALGYDPAQMIWAE